MDFYKNSLNNNNVELSVQANILKERWSALLTDSLPILSSTNFLNTNKYSAAV